MADFRSLLPDRGERCLSISDKQRALNGILWVLRTRAPRRDMPAGYENWISLFVRLTGLAKLDVNSQEVVHSAPIVNADVAKLQ
jgi:transposase